jgi:chorismate mutase
VAERAETPNIRRLRRRIDTIDRQLVTLLDERTEIAIEIGREKRAAGLRSMRDAGREDEVLKRVTEASRGPFPLPALLSIYRRLIAATRAVEASDSQRPPDAGG